MPGRNIRLLVAFGKPSRAEALARCVIRLFQPDPRARSSVYRAKSGISFVGVIPCNLSAVQQQAIPNHPSPQVALSSFEAVAADLALSPDEYAESLVLKQWVIENKDKRYVPDSLLSKWGLRADVRFV